VLSKGSIKNNRKRQKKFIEHKIYIDDDDNFFVVKNNLQSLITAILNHNRLRKLHTQC